MNARKRKERTTDEMTVLNDIEGRIESIFDDYTIHDIHLGIMGMIDGVLTEIKKRKKEIRDNPQDG